MKKRLIAALLGGVVLPAYAIDPIGDEKGWSGHINLGAGFGAIETNFLSEISGFDLGDEKIDQLGSPDDDDIGIPSLGFNIGYNFDGGKTRVQLSNIVVEPLDAGLFSQLALIHDFGSIGTMQIAGISNLSSRVKEYADPYQSGVKRGDTDADQSGGRFTWEKMFGSNFEIDVIARNKNIDDEDSGIGDPNLTKAQRDLLDRQGDILDASVGYLFELEGGKHKLRPIIGYVDRDLDGDAMSQDGFTIGLGYTYTTSSLVWVNKLSYSDLDGDKNNPIFGEANDADEYEIGSTLMFPGAFGLKHWMPAVGAAYSEVDSDVDFNDSSIWLIRASMYRRF